MIAVADEILGARMNELLDKEHLLEGSGYRYHFARMIYRNRTTKVAFSIEFIDNHSVQELRKLIETPATGDYELAGSCRIAGDGLSQIAPGGSPRHATHPIL